MEGISLLSLIYGKDTDKERKGVFSEIILDEKNNLEKISYRTANYKLIYDKIRKNHEFYNLSEDPKENKNLYQDNPKLVTKYIKIVENFIREMKDFQFDIVEKKKYQTPP